MTFSPSLALGPNDIQRRHFCARREIMTTGVSTGHWYVMIGVTQALIPPEAIARMTSEIAKGTIARPDSSTFGAAAATRMTWPSRVCSELHSS